MVSLKCPGISSVSANNRAPVVSKFVQEGQEHLNSSEVVPVAANLENSNTISKN